MRSLRLSQMGRGRMVVHPACYVEVREFLLQTKTDLIRLFASANLLAKDAPFLVRVIGALTKSSYSSGFKADLAAEIQKVSAGIDAGAKNSRLRIEGVQARVAQPRAAADAPPLKFANRAVLIGASVLQRVRLLLLRFLDELLELAPREAFLRRSSLRQRRASGNPHLVL